MASIYIGDTPQKHLRFICAQPANEYYAWQVEVLLTNFRKHGINLNQVDIVCWKIDGVIPESWIKLANGYAARFFFYDDTRETKHYISSIRPNILKQHWEKYPELKDDAIFYHDCDILFTKPPTEWITDIMIGDKKWYGSDTRWYIGHTYIKSKGVDILDKMCEIVGIDKGEVESNELANIGAQYLMKNIDFSFWDKVEKDCERLFKEITEMNVIKKQENPNYHELQIWCADMWAVLWNGWLRGNQTICHENFDFSWATSQEEEFHRKNIFHNAGVIHNKQQLFYKADYMEKYPYDVTLTLLNNTASYQYWLAICEAAKNTKLL
jgi:hypothetical protein